jgi:hypothetical protein
VAILFATDLTRGGQNVESVRAQQEQQRIWDLEAVGEYLRDEKGLPVVAVFERARGKLWFILQGGATDHGAHREREDVRVIEK